MMHARKYRVCPSVFVRIVRACALALLSPFALGASLKWIATSQRLVADPTRTEVTASFAFRNESASPVTILEVRTSCGCTAAALEQATYAAGESGRIAVVLRYTGDVSPLSESVTVLTDERSGSSYKLDLEVVIPAPPQRERIDVQPRYVRWKRGAALQSQVVNLRIRDRSDAIRPVGAMSDDPAFRVQLRDPRADEPGLYELVITPLALDTAREAVVSVLTNSDRFERGSVPIVYRVGVAVE